MPQSSSVGVKLVLPKGTSQVQAVLSLLREEINVDKLLCVDPEKINICFEMKQNS
jgi:hypothetical protein